MPDTPDTAGRVGTARVANATPSFNANLYDVTRRYAELDVRLKQRQRNTDTRNAPPYDVTLASRRYAELDEAGGQAGGGQAGGGQAGAASAHEQAMATARELNLLRDS